MKDPVINYKPEIDSLTKQIIDEYWQNENGEFHITVKDLLIKYGFTLKKLETIIRSSSYEIFSADCIDCKGDISKIVNFRRHLKSRYTNTIFRCDTCKKIYSNHYEKRKLTLQQEFYEEMKRNLEKGIDDKKWLILDSNELKILKQIVKYKTKELIKSFVFNDDFYDNSIWDVVKKLSKFNLIEIERSESNSVIDFHFDNRLENLIVNINPVAPTINDIFSLSLCKKNNITKDTDPEYSGTFILLEDIIIKKGLLYIYAGWRKSDESIDFKFTPANKINKKPIQGNIDNDPDTRLYISKMNNNLDKDDDSDDESGSDESLGAPW